MAARKPAERFKELQHDKKVVLTETALLLLGIYKARLWEDPNYFSKLKPLVRLKYAAKTTAWFNASTARQGNIDELMESADLDETDAEKIAQLRERMSHLGAVAAETIVQIRGFRFGETPWWQRKRGSALSGKIFMARSETPEGGIIEDHILDVSKGVNVESDAEVDRLQRAAAQLSGTDENPLQNG